MIHSTHKLVGIDMLEKCVACAMVWGVVMEIFEEKKHASLKSGGGPKNICGKKNAKPNFGGVGGGSVCKKLPSVP